LRRAKRGLATPALVIFLILSCAGFSGLKLVVDRIPRKKIPGASVIYIPSGKYLKYATLGYSSFMADLIYLWAIQYYSTYTIVDRFQNLMHIFSIIAELDPRYVDPYEVGALIAAHEARDLNLAYQVLDLGLAKNPKEWFFPFLAGHYAQLAKDFETARKYFKITMEIPGAPDFVKRLYAAASFRVMDFKTSWETWLEVYNTAPDDRTRKIASNHLYRVKSTTDINLIKEAIEKFRQRSGRLPNALSELVKARVIPSLPKDMDGKDYLYDPKTGSVEAPTIWWKRSL